jgi:hypothetical protein
MEKPTLEELVESYNKAKGAIEETQASLEVLRDELFDRLKKMKMDGIKTKNGYFVKRVIATSFSGVELSTAKELGATTQKEVVDMGMLRKLQEKGIKIKGSKIIQYIKITEEL